MKLLNLLKDAKSIALDTAPFNRDINIRMIIDVAKRLGDLRDKVVFVGECATGLFITDPAIPEVRGIQDLDVIVEVASRIAYSPR